MNHLKKSKAFYVIVMLLGFLFLWKEIKAMGVVVNLFQITINTLLVPTIVSLFIYYLLKPLYLLLLKHLKSETLSLIFSLLIFSGIFLFLVREFIPLLLLQIDSLVKNVPQMIQEIDEWVINSRVFSERELNEYLLIINHSFEDFINLIFVGLRNGTNLLFGFVSSSFLVVSIMPIMVIYLLKNTNKAKKFHQKLPKKYQSLAYNYFVDLEKTLSDYISGKAFVCFYVFLGAWLTFSIAGLKGALLFAVVAGIMDIVPYFGPWIGAIPAVIAGLVTNDVNVLIIVVGIIIVQL
ncbi:MAG: AI-2E family transporter, partial [Enterococcus sp.]|nr:AI-2E family transporter [Enterococcus sp.]